MPGNRVCVLGSGPLGLVATKNLTEQGFDVTTFEKQDCIGGIWHPNLNQLSVLHTTIKNTSKQVSSFTDFPYPKDAATHPSAAEVERYLNSYASHFNVVDKIKLSTEVIKIERNEKEGVWVVTTRNIASDGVHSTRDWTFDRVVVASGMLSVSKMPSIAGSDKFQGSIMHSREFKDPSKFEDKNVIVVGVGASGIDTQSFLKKSNVKKVYLSHRNQMLLLPRMFQGKAFDHGISRRAGLILRRLLSLWPVGTMKLMLQGMNGARKKAFPSLNNHPSFTSPRLLEGMPHRVPMFSDDLADNLKSGIVEAVQGISKVIGPRSVLLTDGTVLDDIEAIIVCSGYTYDFSVLSGTGSPINPDMAPDGYASYKAGRFYNPEHPFARLYRGFLSEQYPDSLAFLGHALIPKPPFVMNDLITMALASLWSGSYTAGLPSSTEMKRDIDGQYHFMVKMLDRGPIPYPGFRTHNAAETYAWLNEVAGTGVCERLGNWSLSAWRLWWSDRKFYGLLMDGPDTPYVYRLFETSHGRKPWANAREQIIQTNQEIKEMGENWKNTNMKTE